MSFRFITGEALPVADTSAQIPKHHLITCFGCGPENPHRLGIVPGVHRGQGHRRDGIPLSIRRRPGTRPWWCGRCPVRRSAGVRRHDASAPCRDGQTRGQLPPPDSARSDHSIGGLADGGRRAQALRRRRGFAPNGTVLVEVIGLFVAVGAEHFTNAIEGVASPYPNSVYESGGYYP